MFNESIMNDLISRGESLRQLANSSGSERDKLIQKPEVKDLMQMTIPYVVKNVPLINEGVHNGDFYPSSILRNAVTQHEKLSLFLDHHDNFIGGTARAWCGDIRNPRWNEEMKSITGDLYFVEENTARAVAYGAKFGVSCTVDADTRINPDTGKKAIFSPVFRSYSVVLDPAVRETMLNSKKQLGGNTMEPEQNGLMHDLASDFSRELAQAMAARYSPDQLSALMGVSHLKRKPEEPYEYPGVKKKKKGEAEIELEVKAKELETKMTEMDAQVKSLSEKTKTLEETNKELSEQVDGYKAKELEAEINSVVEKEKEMGMLEADSTATRLEELKKLSMTEVLAISSQLDRTLKATDNIDSQADTGAISQTPTQPAPTAENLAQTREGANRKLLEMMRTQQDK